MFRSAALRLPRPLLRATSIRSKYTPSHFVPSLTVGSAIKILPRRPFGTTAIARKKSGEGGGEASSAASVTANASGHFDFDEHFRALEEGVAKITKQLEAEVSKFRGDRVDPALFEALEVVLDRGSGGKTVLRDVAHVVPKEQALAVTVHEAVNVKKVVAAIQKTDLNVQPMVDLENPKLLNVPLPAPTKESKMQTAGLVGKVGEKALRKLRLAGRWSRNKIESLRSERPGDTTKADKKLKEIMEKATAEMKDVIEAVKKAVMDN